MSYLCPISAPEQIYTVNNVNQLQIILKKNQQLDKHHFQIKFESDCGKQLSTSYELLKDKKCYLAIDLSRGNLTDNDCVELQRIMSLSNIVVYQVNLSFNKLHDGALIILLQTQQFSRINNLNIGFTDAGNQFINFLNQQTILLKTSSQLFQLQLTGTKITDGCANQLATVLQNSHLLQSLSLSGTRLQVRGLHKISKQLNKMQQLQSLDVSALTLEDTEISNVDYLNYLQDILFNIVQNQNIQRIDFSGTQICDYGVQHIYLALTNNTGYGEKRDKIINSPTTYKLKHSKLQKLLLNNIQLTSNSLETVVNILSLDTNICELQLKGNNLDDNYAIMLLKQINNKINTDQLKLDLRQNNITNQICFQLEKEYKNVHLYPNNKQTQTFNNNAGHRNFYLSKLQGYNVAIEKFNHNKMLECNLTCEQQKLNNTLFNSQQQFTNLNPDYEPFLAVVNTGQQVDPNKNCLAESLVDNITIRKKVQILQIDENEKYDDMNANYNLNQQKQLINPQTILSKPGNVQNLQQLIQNSQFYFNKTKKIDMSSLLQNWEMVDEEIQNKPQKQPHIEKQNKNRKQEEDKCENDSCSDSESHVSRYRETANDIASKLKIQQNQLKQKSKITKLLELSAESSEQNMGTNLYSDEEQSADNQIKLQNQELIRKLKSSNIEQANRTTLSGNDFYGGMDDNCQKLNYSIQLQGDDHQIQTLQSEKGIKITEAVLQKPDLYRSQLTDKQFQRISQISQYQKNIIDKDKLANSINTLKSQQSSIFQDKLSKSVNVDASLSMMDYVPNQQVFCDLDKMSVQEVDQIRQNLYQAEKINFKLENFKELQKLNLMFPVQTYIQIDCSQNEDQSIKNADENWDLFVLRSKLILSNRSVRQAIKLQPTADINFVSKDDNYITLSINDWETQYEYVIRLQKQDYRRFVSTISVWAVDSEVEKKLIRPSKEKENIIYGLLQK